MMLLWKYRMSDCQFTGLLRVRTDFFNLYPWDMRNKIWIILVVTLLMSCNDAYDAEKTAQQFCNCIKETAVDGDYDKALAPCHEKFKKENIYYKLYYVDMYEIELDEKISKGRRDSVVAFMSTFDEYFVTHCCKEVQLCSDSLSAD